MEVPSPPGWFSYALATILGLFATLLGVYRNKVDKMDERQRNLIEGQGRFVTRDELERHMDQIREDRLEMHKENLKRLETIGNDINRVHARIDQALAK